MKSPRTTVIILACLVVLAAFVSFPIEHTAFGKFVEVAMVLIIVIVANFHKFQHWRHQH
ncbi:hypothetical protein ACFQET_09370 [Levilactobacillus tangyuanensis]|uniref:Uncharacterized protein n=1 Tax=Levilactobacillus tangyuanensis TaxID=2486021 RepID=A0ABW1TSG9_9LACO|nr:hypothetical protein [Levilactobacillus tangyuanensis]